MNAVDAVSVYRNQQVMTAPPEELTLMLYNGAIRFVNESIIALDQKNHEKANRANLRAQAIIHEFMATLDMKYEISGQFMALYEYIHFRLVQANIKKDKEQLEEARGLIEQLRDGWAEAVKSLRLAKVVGR